MISLKKLSNSLCYRYRARCIKDCDLCGSSTIDVATSYWNSFFANECENFPEIIDESQLDDLSKCYERARDKFRNWLFYEFREWGSSVNDVAISLLETSFDNTIEDAKNDKYKA